MRYFMKTNIISPTQKEELEYNLNKKIKIK